MYSSYYKSLAEGPEFDRIKLEYGKREKLVLAKIKSIEVQRDEILNASIRFKITKWLDNYFLYVGILLCIFGLIKFGFGGLIICIGITSFSVQQLSAIKKKLEINVLSKSGAKWQDLKRERSQAESKLNLIKREYAKAYDTLCVNCKTYPPDWTERREIVIKRDNGCCVECGYPQGFQRRSRELHVHHIKSLSEGGNNSLSNLKTLCHICHRSVDKKHAGVRKIHNRSRRRF